MRTYNHLLWYNIQYINYAIVAYPSHSYSLSAVDEVLRDDDDSSDIDHLPSPFPRQQPSLMMMGEVFSLLMKKQKMSEKERESWCCHLDGLVLGKGVFSSLMKEQKKMDPELDWCCCRRNARENRSRSSDGWTRRVPHPVGTGKQWRYPWR